MDDGVIRGPWMTSKPEGEKMDEQTQQDAATKFLVARLTGENKESEDAAVLHLANLMGERVYPTDHTDPLLREMLKISRSN